MSVTCRFDENRFVLKIYNDCYGGGKPRLNSEAKQYFNSMTGSESERLLITLEKYGRDAVETEKGSKFTSFGIILCPKECAQFFDVEEYDGLERPYINRNEYLKHLINQHYSDNENMHFHEYENIVKKSQEVKLKIIDINE